VQDRFIESLNHLLQIRFRLSLSWGKHDRSQKLEPL
jgi:hypothetical protein